MLRILKPMSCLFVIVILNYWRSLLTVCEAKFVLKLVILGRRCGDLVLGSFEDHKQITAFVLSLETNRTQIVDSPPQSRLEGCVFL